MAIRSFRSWLVLALLCSAVSALPASADAVRAKKGRANARVEAPRVISVLSATHPQLAQESMAAGSLLRVTGVGFGQAADAHATLKAAGVDEGVKLTVVSWNDHEIVLQLPSVSQLGIDPATAAAIESELRADKPLFSMRVSIALSHGASEVTEPIALRIVLAAFDFDNDGVTRAQDANDLDPQVH